MAWINYLVEATKRIPWWQKMLTGALGTYAGKKLLDKIFADKKMSFDEKLDRLNKMRDSGEITQEEYELARKSLFQSYGRHDK